MNHILEINNISGGYGEKIVFRDCSLHVNRGAVSVLLGANGAGKTTLLRAISGLLKYSGSIKIDATDISKHSEDQIARLGVAHVVAGRGTFMGLSVEDNLNVGGFRLSNKNEIKKNKDLVLSLFPELANRAQQVAGSLSGGEQQMLAIGRALMMSPKLMLLDEPSMGLAPVIVKRVYDALKKIKQDFSLSMLVVEQNASIALSIADYGYVLETGKIVKEGTTNEILKDAAIVKAYLG